ncbi:MAG TPA: hypothetical protein ENO00_04970 [Deltaproteobacteria bacterium]|nr:hypothetical protein [Deltaproteobacteria bacterium]
MKIEQAQWTDVNGWNFQTPPTLNNSAQLVLVFGNTVSLKKRRLYHDIRERYPHAHVFGCSTAGEICGIQVFDGSLITTAIHFEHSRISIVSAEIEHIEDSMPIGEQIARSFSPEGLVHVFVLSDGLKVNGSALVEGLVKQLPKHVTVTGGLSGDGNRFHETLVMCDAPPETNLVTALGLYGERLHIGYGSMGGWDPFGPERLVTRSKDNTLYELDGRSALEIYKRYLGSHAGGLPATGLLFPLSIRHKDGNTHLVRTILSINEEDDSMIFAGDIPEGAYAWFMKANINRLIDGAGRAAHMSRESVGSGNPDLAILISCVGRKMVLKQRVEEEVEEVREVLGSQTVLAGFYSYGEISPSRFGSRSELHNQTMTVTTFGER